MPILLFSPRNSTGHLTSPDRRSGRRLHGAPGAGPRRPRPEGFVQFARSVVFFPRLVFPMFFPRVVSLVFLFPVFFPFYFFGQLLVPPPPGFSPLLFPVVLLLFCFSFFFVLVSCFFFLFSLSFLVCVCVCLVGVFFWCPFLVSLFFSSFF